MSTINAPRKALRRIVKSLPASWYADPSHYERELNVFWHERWVAVGRAEEIARTGDYRVVELGTQSIVILRDEKGLPRAYHNTCRHRGSILCTESSGRFKGGQITCPYHAWTYGLNGKLVATPRRLPTPDFNFARYSLYEIATDQWGGFIFVNLSRKKPPPLAQTLGELPIRFARYGFENLRIGKRIVADVRANWKLLAENFSECLHCPPVHPELCRVVTAYQEGGAWGLRVKPESRPEYKPGAKTLTLDGSARIPTFHGLNEREQNTPYVPWMSPPNLFLNIHPDYVNAHMMFPTGPASVRIIYDWLFEAEHLPTGADLEHYVSLWEITNRQDARNCEWQQQGMRSLAFKSGIYVPQEFDCARFADWVRNGLRGSKLGARRAKSNK